MEHPCQGTATKSWCYERSRDHYKFLLWNVNWNSCKDMAILTNEVNISFKWGSNESLLFTVMSLTVFSLLMLAQGHMKCFMVRVWDGEGRLSKCRSPWLANEEKFWNYTKIAKTWLKWHFQKTKFRPENKWLKTS